VAQRFSAAISHHPNLTDVIPNRAEGPVRNLLLISPASRREPPAALMCPSNWRYKMSAGATGRGFSMNAALAEIIIKIDTNDHRFEEFARQTCSLEHGIEFVPTSRTWDRGRDGRTTGSATSGFANLLCATLNREIDGKVEADLLRLTATSSPKHLIYCCSQPLSEHAIDVLDKSIRRHIPTGSITIYGSEQLATSPRSIARSSKRATQPRSTASGPACSSGPRRKTA